MLDLSVRDKAGKQQHQPRAEHRPIQLHGPAIVESIPPLVKARGARSAQSAPPRANWIVLANPASYDLIKPLSHSLDVYAALCGQLPQDCGADALVSFRKKLEEQSAADGKPVQQGLLWDAKWGFSVQAFAAKRQIDFRYYGAGKRLGAVPGKPPERIVAIETAPGSRKYDVMLSDFSRERVDRSQLP